MMTLIAYQSVRRCQSATPIVSLNCKIIYTWKFIAIDQIRNDLSTGVKKTEKTNMYKYSRGKEGGHDRSGLHLDLLRNGMSEDSQAASRLSRPSRSLHARHITTRRGAPRLANGERRRMAKQCVYVCILYITRRIRGIVLRMHRAHI